MLDRAALQRDLAESSKEFSALGMRLRLPHVVASDLTLQQLKVLTLLIWAEPPLAAHDVAQALGVTPATISGLVSRLVEHGLIQQLPDESDRRTRRLLVTDQGAAALEELSSIQEAHRLSAEDHMSDDELAALARGMRGFVRGLRATVAAEESAPT